MWAELLVTLAQMSVPALLGYLLGRAHSNAWPSGIPTSDAEDPDGIATDVVKGLAERRVGSWAARVASLQNRAQELGTKSGSDKSTGEWAKRVSDLARRADQKQGDGTGAEEGH